MNVFELFGTIAIDNSQATKSLDKVGKDAKAAGKAIRDSFSKIGSATAKVGKAVVGATAAVGGALVAAVEGTRDYRTAMAKLDTAFKTNGHSAETAKKTYQDLQSVLGDTDVAVEAANHLAVMCKNEQDLQKWTDICTGVFATFGDSLPIEGLTESANETAKVGQVTGSLADALNWAGISEDDFNLKLRACRTEQERQELIVNHLTNAYRNASAQYQDTADDIIKANRAQESWNAAMAALGRIGEPILTTIKQKTADMVLASVPHLENFITKFKEIENIWTDIIYPMLQSTFKVAFGIELPEWSTIEATVKSWWASNVKPKIEGITKAVMGIKLPDLAALAKNIDLDWQKLVMPTITGLLTGNYLTITPLIGVGLAGLITSNWDTTIAPVLGDLLNQDISFNLPDFETLKSNIVNGWNTYVSADVTALFESLGANLSTALGNGGQTLGYVLTGFTDFGKWCTDNKQTISEFFGAMSENGMAGIEIAGHTVRIASEAISGLLMLGTDAVTGTLQWILAHGEETALAIDGIAAGLLAAAIAAHPFAVAIMAAATALGLMYKSKVDEVFERTLDNFSNEDLELLQRWIDAANEAKRLEDDMLESQESYDAYMDAQNRADALQAEVNAIEGLKQAYSTWSSSQPGYKGEGGMYLDVPVRTAEGTEDSVQGELDAMDFQSQVKMYADASPIQTYLNQSLFTAYATVMPTGSTSVIPGHASGLDEVPYDNYIARLHKGEAVLNSTNAEAWRRGSMGGNDIGRLEAAINNLGGMLQQVINNTAAGHQVVLDTGVLAGQMAPKMDVQLGTIGNRKGRRN